ncbi:MAG: pseudouridine synthase [Anaerolineae bacterium]
MPSEGERLQKVMARAGVASRRASEAMIVAGRVSVNGERVTELGTRVDPLTDRITVDGKVLASAEPHVYVALFKPSGYLSSSSDPHGGKLAMDLVPVSPRLYPVGRLDRDSEGLMLLTNDGELALRLTHPRYEQEKEYRVLISRPIRPQEVARLRQGIALPGKARPARATVVELPAGWCWRDEPVPVDHRWVGLILREGYKREIREMLAQLGINVRRLIRVRIGTAALGALEPGEHRHLTPEEITDLRRLTGLAAESRKREQA